MFMDLGKNLERVQATWMFERILIVVTVLIAFMATLELHMLSEVNAQSKVVDLYLVSSKEEIDQNEVFTVDIVVEPNGQEIAGVQAFIDFDREHIKVTSLTFGSKSPLQVELAKHFDNDLGKIEIAAGTLGDRPKDSFTLGAIVFESQGISTFTKISFSTNQPDETLVGINGRSVQRYLNELVLEVGNMDRGLDTKMSNSRTSIYFVSTFTIAVISVMGFCGLLFFKKRQ